MGKGVCVCKCVIIKLEHSTHASQSLVEGRFGMQFPITFSSIIYRSRSKWSAEANMQPKINTPRVLGWKNIN